MKPGLLIGLGVIAVAVVGAIVFVMSSLDSFVEHAIEATGSEATQANVTLDGVDIDLTGGSVALNGLNVGNPKGFQTPSSFKLGGVKVVLNTATATKKVIIIKEISIDGPEITYELTGKGSNVDAIKRNVDAFATRMGAGGGKAEEKPATEGEGPKLVIEHLYVRGGTVNVSASILKGETLSAGLPDIHLTDIGKDKGGASPAEVTKELIDALTATVGDAMASIGVGKTLDSLKGKLGDIAGSTTEKATQAVEGLKDQAGGATDSVKKAGESLKKMFGR